MEIELGGRKFTIDSNSDKYRRAVLEAGSTADDGTVLAIYDHLAGLIRDESGNKVENGHLWERYRRWKDEQPKYIKALEDKDRNLSESEDRVRELGIKIIDHKRALLGNLMIVASAIVAGLFLLLTIKDLSGTYTYLYAIGTGIGFAFFIVTASYYMMEILSHDSVRNDKHLAFVQDTHKDLIAKVGNQIVDLDSYEQHREQKHAEEKELIADDESTISREIWFRLIIWLFILCAVGVLATFISGVV